MKQLTETIYHLINLKLAVSFPHLEQYTREQQQQPVQSQHFLDTGIRAPKEAIFHCGQILRVVRGMEVELRQLWWPAAVYRVAVVLWVLSTAEATNGGRTEQAQASNTAPRSITTTTAPIFAIDNLSPDDPVWQPFIKYNRGTPCVTAEDGTLCPLEDRSSILRVCMALFKDEHAKSHLADYFHLKLEALCH
jgi:hypothetical protein